MTRSEHAETADSWSFRCGLKIIFSSRCRSKSLMVDNPLKIPGTASGEKGTSKRNERSSDLFC